MPTLRSQKLAQGQPNAVWFVRAVSSVGRLDARGA